ncbi:uncharacterized protein [Apostichopus japonicus]|uniref:uncharacterized protein isoform X5 n=1 Tax=Stichopus japonicus TaxID=307972 RepID=UPI003AB63713
MTVTEGDAGQKSVAIQVCRQPSSEAVTLAVYTVADYAVEGSDFVGIPNSPRGDVTLSAGQTCTSVNVFVISDMTPEMISKTFVFIMYDPQPSSSMIHIVSGHSQTTITITDDDPVDNIPPVVSCINDITREIPLNSFGVAVDFTEPTATDNSGTASVLSATRRPGQFFQTGTTTVTYIFADPSGNTADCVFDIIVVEVDDTPPDVTCIQDITRIVTIDSTGITVFWTEPTAADNSGVVSLQSRSHAPGDFFSQGTTQVTYIFVDPSGNNAFCIFTVTVTTEDNVPPVVSCIPDVADTTPLGTGGRLVFFTEPTATDDSGVVSLQQRTHGPGTFFSSGVTQVTYIFVDPAGNTAECTFRVNVTEIDEVPPVIACVGLDVSGTIPLNGFGTAVQFREPTATDNSGTANVQSRTHTPGQFFQSGTTQVTYVFIDPSGNTAECSFNIIITEVDNIPPVVSCINDITREIPLNSFGVAVDFTEPTATDNSGTASVLSATRRPGQFFQTGTTTVTYIFADPSGNTADCVFDIIVVEVDDTPPDVTCIQDITRIVTIDSTGITVFWTEPTAADNSGVVSLQSRSHAPGDFFSQGTTQVTYIFVDPSGNNAFCIFTVTVATEDNVPPVVSCIPDVADTTPLGTGGRLVFFTEPTATDDSGVVSLQQRTHGPGTFFSSGVTQVTYIFVDPAGNTAECTFRVNVTEIDEVPPVIACVGLDVSGTIPLNGFGTAVQFREPTATDNSGTANVQSRTHTPGQFFQSGTTQVTYVFIDPSGNTAECSFNIIITEVDDTPPDVTCIQDITRIVTIDSTGITVFWTEPTAADNSGVVSLQSRSHAPGDFFSQGTTQVTYIFVDPSGNNAFCIFTVTVATEDNVPPVVSCIPDVADTTPLGTGGRLVFFTEPTATDDSGVVSLQQRTHGPGTFFSSGVTQVTYIFVDPAGNTAECTFRVNVTEIDEVPPVIACVGLDVSGTIPLNGFGTAVQFREPTATDNSGTANVQSRTHTPGQFFQSGTTQVTYVFIDPSGNTAECSFNIIITEVDEVPPVIACVGLDVSGTIPLNGFGTTVQFREPTATDNSGTANVQSRTHAPGQFFQSGTTQVTYVFIDPSGNTAECSFNIIITEVDNIPPVVSCINDITREIPLNSFGVAVDFTEPTATDNSGTASVLSATRRPGQFFQTGTTTVTYIFADPSGNTADCVFDIIVVEVDDTPPDVTCIQDITRIVTIDSTGITVFWTEPTAADNSGVVSLQSRSHAPGDFFSQGTTQVTYIFVDPSGNNAFCIFTVTVTTEDNVPPVVSCIPDVADTTPLGTGGRLVFFTEPTATDDSGVVSLQQRTHGPGTFYSSGVTQVTYIFVDPAGNTAECTFRVNVTEIDEVPPVIACVGLDVSGTIPLNGFGTTVQFREPTATDNSGTANVQSRTHAPGQFFQSGTTQVTYVFIDPSGNTAECSFNIIITEVDNIPPVVSCINDITREIPLNSFGVAVDFTEPTATDNSGTASVLSATRRPGQFFQTGTTTVTYIFADPSGNTADCVFDIIVVEVDDTPPDVTCIQDITRIVTIDSTGITVFWTEPTAADNSGVVSLQSRSHAPGDLFSQGTTQVTYIFVDPSGNNAFCIFTVTVTTEDNVPPVVSCIPDVADTTPLGTGGRLVFFTEPTATDDSGVVSLQQRTHGPGTFFISGVTQITYIFVDPAGNTAECTFRVNVTEIDEVPPVIACVGLDVSGTIPLNGFGTAVQFREPTATDNSGTANVQSRTHTPGQFFQSGTTQVTYVFIDPSGNTAECSFNIIITEVDNIPPVVSCINDITREIPLNSFGVAVDFTEPTATDNSGTASVLSATRRPGQFFQTGTTTVTYIFADPSGNTADCVFDIIVVEVDDTPPDVTCIQDITRIVTIDSTGITVFWTEPTAADNSGVVSLQSRSHAPGDFFSQGTTQVTYIFVDPSGNNAFCIFTVTVTTEDNVPPVVSCIPDVADTTPLGTGGRLVFFTEPTATDDSGVVSLQQRTHGPGTFFSSGVTQVTYIFVDPAGNTAECTFRVNVIEIDEVPPVIACVGLDVSGTIPLNGFGTAVQFREPTATDNSGTANVQSRTHTPGQFFQSGTTQVTYVFIDPSGNTAECSFNIIITEVDEVPPVIACVGLDVSGTIPLNGFGTTVQFREPTATDNSGTANVQSRTHAPGQFFQSGTTQVTYVFIDPSGNTAECSFNIIITEVDDTPPDVTCIQDITRIVTIDSTGITVFWTEPTAADNSGVVSLQSRSHAPGDFFSQGTTQVTYIFVDPSGNNAFCIFTVTVTTEDNVPPVVSCIPDVADTTPLGTGGRLVFFTEPTATDDSGVVSLQQRTHGPGTFFSSGVTQVTYIFVDPAGNTAECTFRVNVTEIDEVPPVIACVGLDVSGTIPLNGFGTAVQFREPTATDNSGTANVQSRTHTPGQFFQSGTTQVTYVFIDPSGNTAECSFNIIITEVDNIPPVVSCINDITREIPLNSFGVAVDFTEPTATDNSGTASVLSATRRPGQFFQTGTTTVTYIIADPSGNTADCVFDIIVVEVDDTPPDVTCIQDITRIVTIDSTGITVFWTEPTAADNSGVVSLQSRSHAPGDFFSQGTTQVTYIFVDPSGNNAFCIFTVTVTTEDNVPPVVSCIPDVADTTPLGTGGRLVFFTEPTATDDSGVVSLQQRTHGPGTFFSSGVTQVTYIFVDPAGNTAECTFRVNVIEIDEVPPVIACVGLDVSGTIPLNGFGTAVQFREPTATDNSGTANVQSRTHTPGQFFQSGTTQVTYVFIDPSGNTAECSFNIIITEVDNIPPVVSCINDITREIPLNSFGVAVDFTEPTATDNSGTASVLSATRRPGQFFQTGTTTVTYIFADPSGNTADCVFDIIVVEVDDTPPDVTCIQDITRIVTIDSTGITVFWTEPTAADNSGVVSLQSRSHAPGDFFSQGTTQVTYIFVDPSGNNAFCIFTVTVTTEDNVPPVVSCIPDVADTTPLGTGGRLVFFTEPTATDDSGVVSLQQRTHGPGTFYSSGVTQVTYIFVDPAGNTAECTFRVNVTEIDEVPPVIACVGLDVSGTIPLNGFGTTVQFREPTATDNSGTANVQSRTHAPGQFFQSGTTQVTYVFIDPSGNTAECSFNIIITEVDNIPPVVSCINDITREIPLNSNGVAVDFSEPTATDNSGTASVLSATRRPGQFFQTGTTTVTYIFADPSGNTADCVFDIIVVEVDDTPPDVTCIQDITRIVTIDSTGITVFWTEPTAADNSGVVSLQSRSHAPGDFFSQGTTQVTYIFVDPSGNNAFCIFTVTVTTEDNVPPVVSCIPDVADTTPLGTGGRLVFFTEPTATDDSGVVSLQQRTHGPGTFFSSGVTQVTYIFVDPAGNTAECTFRVNVTEIDEVPPVIACVGLDVSGTIPLNGFGTAVQFREPTATDNSGTANVQSRTHTPGQFFQSGTTQVTYVFIDPSGNTAECSFNIIITEVDNIPPVVSCINDITREIPLNSNGVAVDFTEPTATDNSGTASVLSATRRPGQFFQTGTTTVTYIIADPSGNTADCVFDIIVVEVDDTPPDVTCIQDITRIVTIDSTGITVFWTEPTAADNSGVVSLQSRSHAPGDFFSQGTTQVTYIFVDPSGNNAFCIFTVTVTTEDNVPPVVSCIPDVADTTPLGTGGRLVFFTEPTATDDSGVVSLQQRTHGPGTFFSSGVTQVTYIFVDPAGNTAECTFRVNVTEIDEVPPVIACVGLDVSGTIPLNGFGTTVQFREPTATDNSGTANVQSRTHTPGQFFQSGTTQVTYVFIDPSGNTAECSFNIIITEATELEIQLMDIIDTITRENTTTKEVVLASERIAEISDFEDFLEEDPQRIELVISSLESVVRAGEASIKVTDPAVRTIDNLMNLDRDILEDGMIEGGRAVAALEEQITNFQTNDGNFSTVLDNVGVNVVKIDARGVGSSLAYANILPENETLSIDGALQEGNTRLFSDGDAIPLERTTTSISVPTTVLDLLGGAGVELTAVPVTFIIYGNDVLFRPSMPTEVEENIEEEDKSTVTERIASQIISAIIRTENTSIVNLPPGSPVIATFLSNLKIGVKETMEAQDCVVWSYNENTAEGFWTKDGCKRMFHDNRDLTMCSCDRLGSFAILIRVRKGPVEAQVTLYYITLIGSIISGLALVGCLIIFVSLKSLRSKQPTHIHINLCLSLLGFYIAFLLSPLAVGKEIHCTVASVSIHFFCLATLAWMSTEAMNMYYLFLKAERSTVRHFIPIACLLAYGLPAACALLVVFLDNSTDFQSASYCFIHPGYALYFGFLMEVGAMFVFNFLIFIWVIRKILCRPLLVSKTVENAKRREIIKRVRHAILFWFVLGLSWIFGFFAAVDTKTLIFDYLYCFFISMQGILMFLLLCAANPAFKEKFKKTDSTQTKVTRQAKTRSLSSSQLGSSSQSNIPMDSMDNPSTSATE